MFYVEYLLFIYDSYGKMLPQIVLCYYIYHNPLCVLFLQGLKPVVQLLQGKLSELRLDLTAADGRTVYEVFGNFSIGPSLNYTLHINPGAGSAGISFKNALLLFILHSLDYLYHNVIIRRGPI